MDTVNFNQLIPLLSRNAYEHDIPIDVSFELTPLCNLNCKMCYVHLQDSGVRNRMLSGKDWISVISESINLGMINALLTGGEAMTHPDFWDIYMFLVNNGVITRLKTNGLLMGEEAVARFTQYPPYMIDVSLYGCDSESYMSVTGVDAFKRVTANIKRIITAGLPLRIVVTPSRYMIPWLDRTFKLAESFGVPVMANSVLIEPDEDTGRKKEDFGLSAGDCRVLLEELSEWKENYRRNLIFPEDEHSPKVESGSVPDISTKGLRCRSGRTGFAINWDGTMSPCLGFPRSIVVGNPHTDGFTSAWIKINRAVKNFEVPSKCSACPVNTKCHFCPALHNRSIGGRECDPSVCDYLINYYREI